MDKRTKGILEEYSEITSLLTDEIVKVHKEIHTSIDQIDPMSEYDNFIEIYKSPETNDVNVEFDATLLEETENLQVNEILWNNLTAESLQVMLKSTIEELLLNQQALRSKEELVVDLETKIEESTKTHEKKSEPMTLDKSKDRISKFDTLRHSIAGIIRSPKSVLGSSSVRIRDHIFLMA
ncbi:hypothetical protein DNTS_031816, partial [Danionella cerebrum]